MTTLLIGIALGLAIGVACRWFDIPLPSPPNIVGALLVVAMTLGFITVDYLVSSQKPAPVVSKHHG
jgi:XapX domain-containing protein